MSSISPSSSNKGTLDAIITYPSWSGWLLDVQRLREKLDLHFYLSSWQRRHLLQSVFLLLVLALARRSSWQRSTGYPFTTLVQYASGCMGYNYSMFGHPTPHPIIHPVPFKSRVICRPYGLKKPCIATLTLGLALPRWHTLSIQTRLSHKSTNYYTRANWNGAIRRQLGQNYNTTSTTLTFWS